MTKEEKIKKVKEIYKDDEFLLRSELISLEHNNGWIKILSEDDLPKEECQLFVVEKDTKNIFTYSIFENNGSRKFFLEHFTHYQPIEKPKLPIY